MQPTVLAVFGSAGKLVRLGSSFALSAARCQSAVECVENPWDVINELRASQGRGGPYSRVVRDLVMPLGEDLGAARLEMGGDAREFALRGGGHGRKGNLWNVRRLLRTISSKRPTGKLGPGRGPRADEAEAQRRAQWPSDMCHPSRSCTQ